MCAEFHWRSRTRVASNVPCFHFLCVLLCIYVFQKTWSGRRKGEIANVCDQLRVISFCWDPMHFGEAEEKERGTKWNRKEQKRNWVEIVETRRARERDSQDSKLARRNPQSSSLSPSRFEPVPSNFAMKTPLNLRKKERTLHCEMMDAGEWEAN